MTAVLNASEIASAAVASRATHDTQSLDLSIVLPCLNEAATLRVCIEKARKVIDDHFIRAEVIVVDNGSSDSSVEIAQSCGARLIHEPNKGYGNALAAGIRAARGTFVVMADADDSYDFSHIPRFLDKLRDGVDLVMGNRFLGGIAPGAMPALHRYVGNPLLSGIGRILFASPCHDFHCGLRGFRREAIQRLNLRGPGMEFASEMVVKASIYGLKISEVPTTLSPDGRIGPSHLRSFRDGWRHLRFMLLFSPHWLFLYPGIVLLLGGIVGMSTLANRPPVASDDGAILAIVPAAVSVILGIQAVLLFVIARVLAICAGMLPLNRLWKNLFQWINLEKGLILGAVLFGFGLIGFLTEIHAWPHDASVAYRPGQTARSVALAAISLAVGCQIIMGSLCCCIVQHYVSTKPLATVPHNRP